MTAASRGREDDNNLLWKCTKTRKLWQDICRFILENIIWDFELLLDFFFFFFFLMFNTIFEREYFRIDLIR